MLSVDQSLSVQPNRPSPRPIPRLSADVRMLALARVLVGLTTAYDLACRLMEFDLWYGSHGLISPEGSYFFSLLQWIPGDLGKTWFLLISSIAALVFSLGLKPVWSGIIASIGYTAAARYPAMIMHYGYDYLGATLFWLALTPCADCFRMGFRNGKLEWRGFGSGFIDASIPTRVLLLQGVLFLLTAGWNKVLSTQGMNLHEWLNGSALALAISDAHYSTPLSEYLRTWPDSILAALGLGALAIECLCPVLLVLRPKVARTLGCAGALSLAIGIMVSIHTTFIAWSLAILMICHWLPQGPSVQLRKVRTPWLRTKGAIVILIGCAGLVSWAGNFLGVAGPITRVPIPTREKIGAITREVDRVLWRQAFDMYAQVPNWQGQYILIGRLRDGKAVNLDPLLAGDPIENSGNEEHFSYRARQAWRLGRFRYSYLTGIGAYPTKADFVRLLNWLELEAKLDRVPLPQGDWIRAIEIQGLSGPRRVAGVSITSPSEVALRIHLDRRP